MYSHILLFGATGQIHSLNPHENDGNSSWWTNTLIRSHRCALCEGGSLKTSYKLAVYVHNLQKLSQGISSHPNTMITKGEISDENMLRGALKTGVNVVTLLVGGDTSTKGTVSLSPRPNHLRLSDPWCISHSLMEWSFCTLFLSPKEWNASWFCRHHHIKTPRIRCGSLTVTYFVMKERKDTNT